MSQTLQDALSQALKLLDEAKKVPTLKQLLENHDWSYEYSDDSYMYNRGAKQKRDILNRMQELKCPYTFLQLQKWSGKMVLENYILDPGTNSYYRQEWRDKGWKMYQPKISELMYRDEWEQIEAWLKDQP